MLDPVALHAAANTPGLVRALAETGILLDRIEQEQKQHQIGAAPKAALSTQIHVNSNRKTPERRIADNALA